MIQTHSPAAREMKEACGVFGIAAPADASIDAAYIAYNALFALQHRGQESAGIAIRRDGGLLLQKGSGLAHDVFSPDSLARLTGADAAIGHVRYAWEFLDEGDANAQPILVRHASGAMALCYNGKLVNAAGLRAETEARGGIFQGSTDAEIIAYLIVRERLRTNTTEDAVLNAMQYMVGAYSLVLLNGQKLIAARDPNGFRPLCIGMIDGAYSFASESCVFHALGGEFIRDVQPGEVVVVDNGVLKSFSCGIHARAALCLFEFVYFARPDSVIDGLSVDLARRAAGRLLAQRSDTVADVVIGVPDSGMSAAMGFSAASGIPYAVGLIKNRYIARTFIQPGRSARARAVRIKLNAISSVVRGKRVVLVDDSIVRGTTSAHLVRLLRDAGAREVHFKVSSPPFLHPCYFGTAIPDPAELAAHNRTTEEVCTMIGADSLQYLPIEDLPAMLEGLNTGVCTACFTGDYAVPVPHAASSRGGPFI